jgi:putative endonuclease
MTFEVKTYCVYILTSKPRGVLYIGFSGDIDVRMSQHKNGELEGFTKRYFVKHLVYYETYLDPLEGIKREKQLKKWNREWKIRLIERHNPRWMDLYENDILIQLPLNNSSKIPA